MPYFLEGDELAVRPEWEALAAGKGDLMDFLLASYMKMKSTASHLMSDGYLTELAALTQCRGRRQFLDLLCKAVLDRPPLLHRPGDECECLGDAPWIDGYAYRIHAFLKKNPSRKEYNRNQAQRADLKDAALKKLVYNRDGGCCRYCGSGPLRAKAGKSKDRRKVLHYDHVDPDQPAGPEGRNFVVACARCNEFKGRCTPEEADMVLLPEPTPQEAAAMLDRAQVLLDPPADAPARPVPAAADRSAINGGTAPDHRSDQNTDQKTNTDRISDQNTDQNDDEPPPLRQHTATSVPVQRSDQGSEGSRSGRVGKPDRPAQPHDGQPARTPHHPDPYHKRSRLLEPTVPIVWPADTSPTRPENNHG